MDQETDLENWARETGYWRTHPQDYYKSLGYQFYGFGGEAQVYAEGDSFVHKVCRTGQYDNLIRFFDTVIAEDLHPGNIWMTGDNNVVIVDGAFKFNTPGLGLGGKFEF